ncbi:hypothetical protein SAMN05444336_101270 [Albimonas donghaensis]|uniref:Terminase-like family protein n=1 Tax=Albimonas donghaensis TaxID=356660 RepID=A0A1H2RAM7_9RHOB|nr:hypothetical protein [Albimonas donghaensis]SDW15729.1 hypothetical protein SAMN05444336_101270 [Albimonas donghaensis]
MTEGAGIGAAAARLEGMGAADAVRELPGGAMGDMPSAAHVTFPGPVAQAFFDDDADVVAIQGPVGSGKTTTALMSRVRRAMMMPRSVEDGVRRYKLGLVRETYRQLWATTIPSYLETVPKALGIWAGGRGDPVSHTVRFEDEFGEIEWVAEFLAFGDNVIEAMRGWQVTDIYGNEADTLPVEVLTTGIGRIDRYPARSHFAGYPPELRSWGQMCFDLNAPDEDNWTYRVFHDDQERERIARQLSEGLEEGAKPIRINFHRQPGAREPGAENLSNLAPGYYARQIATMTLAGRGDQVTRLIDNRPAFIKAGDPVFKREFNPAIHVAPDRLRADPARGLRIGLDQGFTPAAVIGQFEPPMRWTILAELMFPTEHLLARVFGERLADLLDERFPGLRVEEAWGDVAGEAEAAQAAENATWNRIVGQTAGFRVRPQRIGANRINPRLEAVRAPLEFLREGRPGLILDPSCRYLRGGFEARYVWTEEVDASGNKRKIPNKKLVEANAMDALQYLLLSEARGAAGPSGFHARASSDRRRGAPAEARGLETGWDVSAPYAGAER